MKSTLLLLWLFFVLAITQTALAQPSLDGRFADLLDRLAPDYYDPAWHVSFSQFKAWIAVIAIQESAGNYSAHSGCFKGCTDTFLHTIEKAKFPFSTGVGLFQLDNCDKNTRHCLKDDEDQWSFWPTIDKLDPEKSLKSVLKWHAVMFANQATTLEDFFEEASQVWFALRRKDFVTNWARITGCDWGVCKKNKSLVSFDIAFENKPHDNVVRKLGTLHWDLKEWRGDFDTWIITAYGPNGNISMQYYYSYRTDIGEERWVFRDSNQRLTSWFRRKYSETRFPNIPPIDPQKTKIAGEAPADHPALQIPPNHPPVPDAGLDLIVPIDRRSTILSGKSSFDPDGDTLIFSWVLVPDTVNSARCGWDDKKRVQHTTRPILRFSQTGECVVALGVSDGKLSDLWAVLITVVMCKFKSQIIHVVHPSDLSSETFIDPPNATKLLKDASLNIKLCVYETEDSYRWVYTIYNWNFSPLEGNTGVSGVRIQNVNNVKSFRQFGPPGWETQISYSEWEWDIWPADGILRGAFAQFGFETDKNVIPKPAPCCFWVHSWTSAGVPVDLMEMTQMLVPAVSNTASSQQTSLRSSNMNIDPQTYSLVDTAGVYELINALPPNPQVTVNLGITVFNLTGRAVYLVDSVQPNFVWSGLDTEGRSLANGVYLYVISYRTNDGIITYSKVKKLLIVR